MNKCNFMKVSFYHLGVCVLLLGACTKKPIDPMQHSWIVDVEEIASLDERVSAILPHLYINTAAEAEVLSKDEYLQATIDIEGNGNFQDVEKLVTRIKGRGNSTWTKPKKPYRLKLDKKTSMFGLSPAKDWVLLANYNDYTLMTNAVAMKIGRQLGMPYTHDIIPIDVTINGIYRGNYNLTQQVEIHENRVNVGEGGVLWELDSYFDEEWQFKSEKSNLPVMLKDPDVESTAQFEQWKSDFQQFDNLLYNSKFPKNNYENVFDRQQFVNFLIVNMLVGNHEIGHPKSVYVHKKVGGKFTMGPLWDFDYAFGFSEEHKRTYFNYVDLSLIRDNDARVGVRFYKKILKDPAVKALFRTTWEDFKNNKFNELMEFIEQYASSIRESQKKDFAKWKIGNNAHAQNKADLKTFLRKRTVVLDTFISGF